MPVEEEAVAEPLSDEEARALEFLRGGKETKEEEQPEVS
jgi:hypothetical protein